MRDPNITGDLKTHYIYLSMADDYSCPDCALRRERTANIPFN
jgi:hypothetical protein